MYKDDDYRQRKDIEYNKEDSVFTPKRLRREDPEYKPEREKTRVETVRQSMPKMDMDAIQKLKLNSSKVIGSIFDRVEFLDTRIKELRENITLRKTLHDDITAGIIKDIDDKEEMLTLISDQNEKRNLKMDISILRKEKRHEQLQFWKDTTELSTELQEVVEQFETEKKIASLFGDLSDK